MGGGWGDWGGTAALNVRLEKEQRLSLNNIAKIIKHSRCRSSLLEQVTLGVSQRGCASL